MVVVFQHSAFNDLQQPLRHPVPVLPRSQQRLLSRLNPVLLLAWATVHQSEWVVVAVQAVDGILFPHGNHSLRFPLLSWDHRTPMEQFLVNLVVVLTAQLPI